MRVDFKNTVILVAILGFLAGCQATGNGSYATGDMSQKRDGGNDSGY